MVGRSEIWTECTNKTLHLPRLPPTEGELHAETLSWWSLDVSAVAAVPRQLCWQAALTGKPYQRFGGTLGKPSSPALPGDLLVPHSREPSQLV